ncbi:alpha/beta hydrolase [Enterococcus casseliflavus]|uniref:alpha/beta hydrolase n=1 Tax=Enterococcus casseliflavus TaxID=37734 RepID=UPI0039A402C0
MKKKLFLSIVIFLFLSVFLSACNKNEEETASSKISGDYTAFLKGDDWGCGISQIILTLSEKVNPESISKNTFKIEEEKQAFDWMKPEDGLVNVVNERTITEAYISDENGERVEEPSNYLTIEMDFTPQEGEYLLLSPDSPSSQYPELYNLLISLNEGEYLTANGENITEIEIEPEIKELSTSADDFKINQFTSNDNIIYSYAYYEPEEKSETLVVWLHGILEGGEENTDPYITALGSKVPTLIGEEFQDVIGGANVLVPQCPTFWMDNTGEGQMVDGRINTDGTSYYLESLHELIEFYKNKTGSEKVVIAGCSNGGYMGMLLALEYGEEYDAYMLICESMENQFISDEKIESIKNLPLFFIYSNDDNIVDPTVNEIPTINRLKQVGASNLEVATFEEVVDTSGRFTDEDGNPHNFGGHNSWIYFFNNEVSSDENGANSWQWLADQINNQNF